MFMSQSSYATVIVQNPLLYWGILFLHEKKNPTNTFEGYYGSSSDLSLL